MSEKTRMVILLVEVDENTVKSMEVICKEYEIGLNEFASYFLTNKITYIKEQIEKGEFEFLEGYSDLFSKNQNAFST